MTGLTHDVWAPLVRTILAAGRALRVVYAEPGDYAFSKALSDMEIFDLSERIMDISPLPGFTSLANPDDENAVCFVPLLGFDGARLAYAITQVQPPRGKIIPVVGVPGFRPEYPFHTYIGNRTPLRDYQAWKSVRYAAANCPFSVFYLLQDIAAEYPSDFIKIALIGTKPHALGALLYVLFSPRRVELIYDHPIRKAGRTKGASKILVYDVSTLGLPVAKA